MVVFSVYVVNKAGGLVYQYDNYSSRTDVAKTFSYPLDFVLKEYNERVVVSFGQRDGIKGIKFIVLANLRQAGIDSLLWKIYEIYSDFAVKNPFYSPEMPIRCDLFEQNLKVALEITEKAGTFGAGS
ncbi:trafficking protein particle complex subunit 4-like isoform X2 [Cetorhinus maximus]